MRHLRMVGIGLVFALLVSAMAAGSASAKSKYDENTWGQFKYCPYEDPEVDFCYAGITSGGSKGGFFQLGNVIVKLSKPVTLQGGVYFTGENEEETKVTPATNGGATLESPELKVQGGLGVLGKEVQEAAHWPQALKDSWKEAKKNKESTVTVKIETAGGNQLYETPNALSVFNLILEEGSAFILPLKVKVSSPWLTKLGGTECTIGNEAFPVIQNLTSSGPGIAGHLSTNPTGTIIYLANSKLVDLNWDLPIGGRPTGCGGSEYESYIDEALEYALNNYSAIKKPGITSLQGSLFIGERTAVKEAAEKGEL